MFLRALAHVLNNSTRKVKAFIIGDGETRDELEAQAKSLGIRFSTQSDFYHPHPLVFTSWRTDVDVINAGLDIMALTSLNEGTPVSLIEAQAANKPIVSTKVGGIQDIVKEGETALLAEIDDETTFNQHLLDLVNDDALRHRLGYNSSQYVLDRFGYKRLMEEMSALYYKLLHKKRSPNVFLQKEVAQAN